MQRLVRCFVLSALCAVVLCGAAAAQPLNSLTDEFYNGLANAIEQNMDAPESCVTAVNDYFSANQDKVEKIRQEAAEAMKALAPEIEKYMSMTEEEAAAMEQKQGMQANRQPKMSAAGQRYNSALKAFSSKYPQYGMRIAGKTMQLVPGFGAGAGSAQTSPVSGPEDN